MISSSKKLMRKTDRDQESEREGEQLSLFLVVNRNELEVSKENFDKK